MKGSSKAQSKGSSKGSMQAKFTKENTRGRRLDRMYRSREQTMHGSSYEIKEV